MASTLASAPDAYEAARDLVLASRKPSASWLQRQLGVGYNTAAAHIERMEREELISAPDHVGKRTIREDAFRNMVAGDLANAGARGSRSSDGHAQISIPVDLPQSPRPTDDRLRLLIERIERLEEEEKGVKDDKRDVYAEGKALGYDTKMMRQIVRLRKMRPDDRAEMEAILEIYKAALGMG